MSESAFSMLLQVVKAVIVTVIFLFLSLVILALIVNATNASSSVLRPAVQVIKPLSVLFGVLCTLKEGRGALKGFLAGGGAFILAYAVLYFLSKSRYDYSFLLVDFFAFLLFGAFSGILTQSLKRK